MSELSGYTDVCFLRLALAICILLLAGCAFVIEPTATQPSDTAPVATTTDAAQDRASEVELLGIITIPNDTVALGTPVGGLSAIAYDEESASYYFLSDDRARFGPARIYQAALDLDINDLDITDLGVGSLDEGDLTWVGMIPLLDATGVPFAQGILDPEGLVYTGEQFYVSTEGDLSVEPPIAPAIMEFTPAGEFVAALPLPAKFIPQASGGRGVRNNQGFESLTRTPDGRYLISGVENALVQDGPAATLENGSPVRLLKIDLINESMVEYVYIVDAIPVAPRPANGDADNGLVELIALDNNGTLLALERSYTQGVGNTIRLYVANMQGAPDVSNLEALAVDEGELDEIESPVTKELLVDFGELGSDLGVAPDNMEGMALGPHLPDGRQVLLVVSDNNFNPSQTTQLWALALPLETVIETVPTTMEQ